MPNKKTYSPSLVIGVVVMIAVFVVTCVIGCTALFIKRDIIPTFSSSVPTVQMANPATTNCVENHQGVIVDKLDAEKNSWSYCALPDGKLCEVWELYRTHVCITPTDSVAP